MGSYREPITRNEASPLFGNPRGNALAAILGNIGQTMFGESFCRSREEEEKAAYLLCFAVRDHPFTDGNKRIGSLLFLLYLRQEGGGAFPQALTAERDLVIRLIVDLLAGPPERSGGTARPARPMNGREYGRCARDRDEPGLAADRFRDAREPVLPVDSGDGDMWCQARLSSRRSLIHRALSRWSATKLPVSGWMRMERPW